MNTDVFTQLLCLYDHVVFLYCPSLGDLAETHPLPAFRREHLIIFGGTSVRNVELCCGVQLHLNQKKWSIMTSRLLVGAGW